MNYVLGIYSHCGHSDRFCFPRKFIARIRRILCLDTVSFHSVLVATIKRGPQLERER